MCHVDSERNCGTWGVGWLHVSILVLSSFSSTFCKELWTLCIGCFSLILYLPSFLSTLWRNYRPQVWYGYVCLSHVYLFFKQFLKGIKDLRCRMVTWFYLISTFFFEHFLQGIKDLKCSMVTFAYLISTFFFKHFLPGIIGLRCRMVTFFYLSFTFFFEHFLQGTMDIRHRLITPPQRHLTNSLQTACGHLTIFTFPHPPYP